MSEILKVADALVADKDAIRDGWLDAIPFSDLDRKNVDNYCKAIRAIADHAASGSIAVDVGVHLGISTAILAQHSNISRVIAIDPYVPYDQAPNFEYSHDVARELFEAHVMRPLGNVTLIRKTSHEAAAEIVDGCAGLVMIDGDHRYEFVKQDIVDFLPKLVPGGVIAGHDYCDQWGAKRACDEMFGGPENMELFPSAHWRRK